jgi:hypothetical protein
LYKEEGSSLSPACCRLISAQVPASLTQCKHEFEWAPFPPRVVLSRCRYCAVSQAHTCMPPLGLQTAKDCMKSATGYCLEKIGQNNATHNYNRLLADRWSSSVLKQIPVNNWKGARISWTKSLRPFAKWTSPPNTLHRHTCKAIKNLLVAIPRV